MCMFSVIDNSVCSNEPILDSFAIYNILFCLVLFCRFFFKSYCDDLQMEIMEEYSDEGAILPLVQGKIIGRVEKISV